MSKTLKQFIDRSCHSAKLWLEQLPDVSIHDISSPQLVQKEEIETYLELASYADSRIAGLEKSYNMPRTCTKGCAHCCYQAVYVHGIETRLIMNWIEMHKNQSLPGLTEKLRKWQTSFNATKLSLSNFQTLEFKSKYFQAQIPCPFLLADQTCSIYQIRPLGCRHYLSMGDPARCKQNPFSEETLSLECWDAAVTLKFNMSYESVQSTLDFLAQLKEFVNQQTKLLPIALIENMTT